MGLLHYHCKNEAVINARCLCNGLNAIVDVTNFFTGVFGDAELIAALEHRVLIVVEPEGDDGVNFAVLNSAEQYSHVYE